jgi:peptidoglycan/xylan/chitin deacetylase (PgdA/CDA1 family)
MRILVAPLCVFALFGAIHSPAVANDCPHNPDALGVSRVLEVDTTGGPLFGSIQYKSTLDLQPNEVVLTFDDGPHRQNTDRVLNALAEHCVKATFFPVGLWAAKHKDVLQRIVNYGHTVGAHSWSHPVNLGKMSFAAAQKQIERGFQAIDAAMTEPVAPFFRFPGLNDSKALRRYTSQRSYAVFSADIGTDDWRGISAREIISRTMARLKRRKSGIVLFHDTKSATAAALPWFLKALKQNGYRIVHLVPRHSYSPDGKPKFADASHKDPASPTGKPQ